MEFGEAPWRYFPYALLPREAIPPKEEDEKDPSEPHEQSELYLRVQYEESGPLTLTVSGFFECEGIMMPSTGGTAPRPRCGAPQRRSASLFLEEKRPTTPSEKDWKPLSWDHVLGTFCSASMKLPSGELRPLPNKVCAWMRPPLR